MIFEPALTADVPAILDLYEGAVAYQRQHGYNVWPKFSEQLVRLEVGERRLWKIVIDSTIACAFTVAYSDPVIWGSRDADRAMYLHRIATNNAFKGRHFVRHITAWARDHARENGLRYLRMDTWANNLQLCQYYAQAGYNSLGTIKLPENSSLPPHYSNLEVRLFEIDLQA